MMFGFYSCQTYGIQFGGGMGEKRSAGEYVEVRCNEYLCVSER
jgi:hypothetical protein